MVLPLTTERTSAADGNGEQKWWIVWSRSDGPLEWGGLQLRAGIKSWLSTMDYAKPLVS